MCAPCPSVHSNLLAEVRAELGQSLLLFLTHSLQLDVFGLQLVKLLQHTTLR